MQLKLGTRFSYIYAFTDEKTYTCEIIKLGETVFAIYSWPDDNGFTEHYLDKGIDVISKKISEGVIEITEVHRHGFLEI